LKHGVSSVLTFYPLLSPPTVQHDLPSAAEFVGYKKLGMNAVYYSRNSRKKKGE
jgi:hypothetical protein